MFPFPKKNVPLGFRPSYGTTYSFEQAAWYGYDGRAEFLRLLDEVKFDWVRLPFFWDMMVDENGEFNSNFEDLEFAIEEANKRNIEVVIAIGLKTPYYPEYHLPKNIKEQIAFGSRIGAEHAVSDDLISVNRKIIKRLEKHDNISHWQIENEPHLANVDNLKIDKSLIFEEVKTVRDEDDLKRPVILNHVGPPSFDREWRSLVDLLNDSDSFGVNAYFKTQGTNLFSFSAFNKKVRVPWPNSLTWPVQSWYFLSPNYDDLRNELAGRNRDLWVLEMQAEPYVRNLEYAKDGDFAFGASDIIKADEFLKSKKVKYVGLWGANFWIYREKLGDTSWINAVKQVVN